MRRPLEKNGEAQKKQGKSEKEKSKEIEKTKKNWRVRLVQKKPGVRNSSARNSGAGNGCAKFMGAWHFWVLSAGNPHAHKIPRFRRGFVFFFWEGGLEVPTIFYRRRNFSD